MTNTELYNLAERVINEARDKGFTIATAESCTGGWIAKALTDIPGSSAVLKGSVVAYHNHVKENLLGVPKALMIKHGAVSQEVALIMAKSCAKNFSTDIAISVTGIAGPGGGSDEKPVGLVHMAVSFKEDVRALEFHFEDNGRDGVRRAAVAEALKILCLPKGSIHD